MLFNYGWGGIHSTCIPENASRFVLKMRLGTRKIPNDFTISKLILVQTECSFRSILVFLSERRNHTVHWGLKSKQEQNLRSLINGNDTSRSLVLYNVFELRTYLLCFVSFCDLFSGVCVQKFRSPLQEKNNFGRHFDTVFPFLIYHKTEHERILWLLVMLIVCKSVIFFVGTERDCRKLRHRNESKAKMSVAVINVFFLMWKLNIL